MIVVMERATNVRGARTRQRLLAAGLELFPELTAAQLLQALSPKAVARRAGVTTGSFYNHFSDHAAYVDALVEYGLSRQPAEDEIVTKTYAKWAGYANAPDTHLLDDFLEMVQYNFDLCIDSIHVYEFVAAMWTRRREPRIQELLKRRYKLYMDDYLVAEDLIRERWNMRIRDGMTMEKGAALMNNYAEGSHIRHTIEPDLVTSEDYARGLLAMISGMLEPDDPDTEPEHLYDFLAQRGVRDWEPADAVSSPARAIVDATIALMAKRDFDECTVENIADTSGMTVAHVYSAWGSRSRLATAVVAQLCEPQLTQLESDLSLGMSGPRILDRQLGRLAALLVDVARSRPVLLSSALQGSIEHLGRPPEDEGNLGLVLVPAIEACQREGTLGDDVTARDVARTLALTLGSQALARREAGADDLLRFVRAVHLPGLPRSRAP